MILQSAKALVATIVVAPLMVVVFCLAVVYFISGPVTSGKIASKIEGIFKYLKDSFKFKLSVGGLEIEEKDQK